MAGGMYPVFLNLAGAPCLVVGGGTVGERKVTGLLEAGAAVTLVSPEATDALKGLAGERIVWHRRAFTADDLEGAALAFAATDSAAVNGRVAAAGKERGVWVNVVTSGEASGFIVPSTIRRGRLTVAVSTGGASPAYAKLVRERLEDVFGEEHERMADLLAELRPRVMARFDDPSDRRAFWERLVNTETLDMIRNGNLETVRERTEQWLSS